MNESVVNRRTDAPTHKSSVVQVRLYQWLLSDGFVIVTYRACRTKSNRKIFSEEYGRTNERTNKRAGVGAYRAALITKQTADRLTQRDN